MTLDHDTLAALGYASVESGAVWAWGELSMRRHVEPTDELREQKRLCEARRRAAGKVLPRPRRVYRRKRGGGGTQRAVLKLLRSAGDDGMRLRDIALASGRCVPQMCVTLNRLITAGLVRRVAPGHYTRTA